MSARFDGLMQEALQAYQDKRQGLVEMRTKLAAVTATAKAPRQAVVVTVNGQGQVTDLKFPTDAYKRMAPAELASTITKTINDARDQARRQSADLLSPVLPPGVSVDAIVKGDDIDLNAVLPADVRGF